MRAAPDAYIYGNHFSNRIARGFGELIRSFLGDFGHNGRGVLISAFAIFLPPRGRQWRMAPKAVRGSRSKPGPQERRPLDSQPPSGGGSPRTAALEAPVAVIMCLRAGSQLLGALWLWGRRTRQRMAQSRLERRRKR
ncbi:hypothetical protein NDU88_000738 [Pleurodeles waltl]|uniref:Uncharacterized protein n=1 Tax=Pleurodeles waltl TaxID=8319 RepID=A0AAV7UQV9_PLEWA|nr:hypothetical protein NDU88_000738 [Pleurodeles waltl]